MGPATVVKNVVCAEFYSLGKDNRSYLALFIFQVKNSYTNASYLKYCLENVARTVDQLCFSYQIWVQGICYLGPSGAVQTVSDSRRPIF